MDNRQSFESKIQIDTKVAEQFTARFCSSMTDQYFLYSEDSYKMSRKNPAIFAVSRSMKTRKTSNFYAKTQPDLQIKTTVYLNASSHRR
jgi:hypothetical protein